MACFIVPATEAIVVKVIEKSVKKAEVKKMEASSGVDAGSAAGDAAVMPEERHHIPLSMKLRYLFNLLIGGSVLLAFEHLWHGEVVPYFPFLTAISNPADKAAMLHEMSTVGVSMAICVTACWGIAMIIADKIVSRSKQKSLVEKGI